MHLMKKHLTVLDFGIGILDVDLAVSNGFDFGAFQDDAGLILVFDEVIEAGFSVVGYDFFMLRVGLYGHWHLSNEFSESLWITPYI
jgi:hypothetical protein